MSVLLKLTKRTFLTHTDTYHNHVQVKLPETKQAMRFRERERETCV